MTKVIHTMTSTLLENFSRMHNGIASTTHYLNFKIIRTIIHHIMIVKMILQVELSILFQEFSQVLFNMRHINVTYTEVEGLDSEKTRPCIVFTQGERALKIPLSNKNLVSDLNPLISYGSGFSFAILEQAFIETLQEPLMDVYEGITERTSKMLKRKLAHNHPDVWWKWTVG